MAKKTNLILLMALCVFSQGFSQESKDIHLQGFVGLSGPAESSMDVGFMTSFGFAVPLNNRFHLSFNFGYWKSRVQEESGSLFSGFLSVDPFRVSVQYFLLPERTVNPFLLLGGSYIFTGFKMDGLVTVPEITISQEVNNVPGFQAGGGLQIKVKEGLFVCIEAAYLYAKAKATTTIQDMNFGASTEDFYIFLNALTLQLGLNFFL